MQHIRNKYSSLLLLVVFMLFQACQSYMESSALQSYIQDEDHGLAKHKQLNGVDIKMQYKPSALIALQFANDQTTKDSLRALIRYYQDYDYYILSYSNQYGDLLSQYAQDQTRFGRLLNELSFNMAEHVMLISDVKDTTYLYDAVYSRMYHMSASTDVMLVFKRLDQKNIKHYDIYLRDFGFNTGHSKFRFYTKDIENIPTLKL